MGENTFVNPIYTRPKAQPNRIPHNRIDWILIGVVMGLALFGLLMVYSAGPKFAQIIHVPTDYFLVRQILWTGVGIVIAFILSRIDYHRYQRLTVIMMGGTLILLTGTALLADTTLGANRSLFSGSIRPAELAKVVAIIYVSVWLTAKKDVLNDLSMGLMPLMLILGVTGGLIMAQPDLSAAITVVVLGGVLFFLAGGEWRQIALTLVVTSLVGWLVLNLYHNGMKRLVEYWTGLHNPLDASYHVQRSLEAIINGGVFGVGIANSSTKYTGLPVAPTDSIFAVIAEEVGLIGSGLVIVAFIILLWRGLKIARNSKDQLGYLLASGISIWIIFEAFINMAVMVNLMPQAGNALPLISYGGSNLVMTMAGIGMLMNISAQSTDSQNPTQGGNTFGSVVDLRWRDRRRSVPRTGHMPRSRQ